MDQNLENLNPQLMRLLAKEVQSLKVDPVEGITVHLDDKDLTRVEAEIEGPADTPYQGGRFRVKLLIDKEFPQSPPKGFFLTKIFHPNVSSRGEICVNTLKKDWKSDLGLKHCFLAIKCLLIHPNPESALNEEAGKLLLENYDHYSLRAKLYTEIHAKESPTTSSTPSPTPLTTGLEEGQVASKKPCTSSAVTSSSSSSQSSRNKKKEKIIKDKKKSLKRL